MKLSISSKYCIASLVLTMFFLLGYTVNIWAFNNLYDTDVRKITGTVARIILFTFLLGGSASWIIALGTARKMTQWLAGLIALAFNCSIWVLFMLNADHLTSSSWYGFSFRAFHLK